MESVDTKMDLTFPFRRKLVAVDKISVKDLAEQFPLLTSRHEINKNTYIILTTKLSLDTSDLFSIRSSV